MRIVFATTNQGKLVEMRQMLSGFDVVSAAEAGFLQDVVEDQDTFVGNALKKAREVAAATKQWAVADDSGICISALNGEPGVYSSRFVSGFPTYQDAMRSIIDKLKNTDDRSAYFESAVVLTDPDGQSQVFSGRIHGSIAPELRGQALPKLPYDTIFMPEGYDKTFAELDPSEKNSISHRGQAFKQLREYLIKTYGHS